MRLRAGRFDEGTGSCRDASHSRGRRWRRRGLRTLRRSRTLRQVWRLTTTRAVTQRCRRRRSIRRRIQRRPRSTSRIIRRRMSPHRMCCRRGRRHLRLRRVSRRGLPGDAEVFGRGSGRARIAIDALSNVWVIRRRIRSASFRVPGSLCQAPQDAFVLLGDEWASGRPSYCIEASFLPPPPYSLVDIRPSRFL